MATAKKPTKKTAVKRAPAKAASKTAVRRVARPAANKVQSFQVSKPTESFFTVRITHQTIYWALLAIIVLALGLWVIDINDRVQRMYDQIDSLNQTETDMTTNKKPATPQPVAQPAQQ